MKRTGAKIVVLVALTVAGVASARADILFYNQSNPPDTTDLPTGGWGNYLGFGVTLNDSALSVDYTAPHSAPFPSEVLLTTLTVRRAGTSSGAPVGDPTQALIKVYTAQNASAASWIGDSTNTGNMAGGISETNIAFTFNNLSLNTATKYYFYFANTAGDPATTAISWTDGRLRVSNNANVTYPSGNLVNNSFGNQDTAYDAVFVAATIPEPATFGLFGVLGLAMLGRRLRR